MRYTVRKKKKVNGEVTRTYFHVLKRSVKEIDPYDISQSLCDAIAKDNETTREDVYTVIYDIFYHMGITNKTLWNIILLYNGDGIKYQTIIDWIKGICHLYFTDHFKTNTVEDDIFI